MEADFLRHFEDSLPRFDLEGKTLRVALSGGCDSIALAEMLYRIFDRERLAAVHVDHGIRDVSAEDAAFVEEFCSERSIPLEMVEVDTPEHAKSRGLGIEEAARELRYNIFREFTSAGEVIATAHTANDSVETLLFNLARGSGPRGLAGIPRERDGIIRPLLDFFRRDIEKWLRAEGISWREDESNIDLRYTRNRVRLMMIPEIKRVFGDGAMERLRRETVIFSACAEFIDGQATVIYENAVITRFGKIIAFDSDRALASFWGFGEIIRKALIELDVSLGSVGFDTIERLWADIEVSRRGRWFPIAEGTHLEYDDSIFFIFSEIRKFEPMEVGYEQNLLLPEGQGSIFVSKDRGGIRVPYKGGKLILRLPRPGDTAGEHKLLRYMSRKGVPRLLRKSVPILFEENAPLYSPIFGRFPGSPSLFELFIDYDGPLGKKILIKL